MNNITNIVPWTAIILGGWCALMGVLHDIAVLARDHAKKYDRDLLRLLMDGHILITCGMVLLLCIGGIKAGNNMSYFIAMACCLSLIVYCVMIWPFLKSLGTMTMSVASLVLLIAGYIYK